MKAVSVIQPWASLIVAGRKRMETRGWKPEYRGPLLIASSGRQPQEAQALCVMEPFRSRLEDLMPLLLGHVLGRVELVDVVEMTPEWIAGVAQPERSFGFYEVGRYAWVLANPVRFETPWRHKGHLGLYDVDDDLIRTKLERPPTYPEASPARP